MKQYNDLVKQILAEGEYREDRTGVGTLSIFGGSITFDLREGFPLVTSKETRWKVAFLEMLWFLRGDASIHWLNAHGSKLWDAWADASGSIRDGYGPQWRNAPASGGNVKLIPRRTDRDADYKRPAAELMPAIDCQFNGDTWWAIGKERIDNETCWTVQFDNGYSTKVEYQTLRYMFHKGTVNELDGWRKRVAGVGYLGNPVPWATKRHKTLWLELLTSCYGESPRVTFGKNRTVSPIWHNFEMFCKTLSSVPRYKRWLGGEDLVLDCDYFGSDVFSPGTCMFLTQDEAKELRVPRPVRVDNQNWMSVSDWAKATSVNLEAAQQAWASGRVFKSPVASGVAAEGVTAEDIIALEDSKTGVWRRQLVVDQVADMVSSLKYNRHSRRHIVNAWTGGDIQDMALPPCHVMHQCYVSDDGHLDMLMYQRSWDVALGAPFNIAGYALLMHLYCRAVGNLTPRHLKIAYGDAHLYANHTDAMRAVADLPLPESRPKLVFNTKNTDIDGYKPGDFSIEGYVSNPFVKLEVAV